MAKSTLNEMKTRPWRGKGLTELLTKVYRGQMADLTLSLCDGWHGKLRRNSFFGYIGESLQNH